MDLRPTPCPSGPTVFAGFLFSRVGVQVSEELPLSLSVVSHGLSSGEGCVQGLYSLTRWLEVSSFPSALDEAGSSLSHLHCRSSTSRMFQNSSAVCKIVHAQSSNQPWRRANRLFLKPFDTILKRSRFQEMSCVCHCRSH